MKEGVVGYIHIILFQLRYINITCILRMRMYCSSCVMCEYILTVLSYIHFIIFHLCGNDGGTVTCCEEDVLCEPPLFVTFYLEYFS